MPMPPPSAAPTSRRRRTMMSVQQDDDGVVDTRDLQGTALRRLAQLPRAIYVGLPAGGAQDEDLTAALTDD